MLNKYISIGNKIEIKPKNNNSRIYLSQIEEIKDDKNITIFSPIYQGRILPLSINSRYDIVFMNELGCYYCSSIVRKRGKKENFFYTELEITSKLEKFQRRNYFRFKCMLEMKYIIMDKNDNIIEKFSNIHSCIDNEKDNYKIVPAVIRDISGGGSKFISNTNLKRGERIELFINLGEITISSIGEIVSSERINNEFYKFEHRAKFMIILEADREKIIKYIFDQQRMVLRKENGV